MLLTALIYSFVFFGVWCLKEAFTPGPPIAPRPFIVGVVFILIAVLLIVVPWPVKVL